MPKRATKKVTTRAKKTTVADDVMATSGMPSLPSLPKLPRFSTDLLERFVPVLLVICIGLSFVVGMLWQKVSVLEKGGTTATVAQGTAATPAPTVSIDQIKGLFDKDLIKFGDASKKLLFVEMADPSCPYCSIAAGHNSDLNNQTPQFKLVSDGGTYVAPVPEMEKLVNDGKASFVYIYYPGHGNGEMGAKALYCAQEQGKFWPVHDVLMTAKGYDLLNNSVKNDKTKSGDVANFLAGAIDKNFLKTCLDSGKYDERLASDMVVAKELGIQGTPGFFVNETSYAGAYSYKDMEPTVTAALGS